MAAALMRQSREMEYLKLEHGNIFEFYQENIAAWEEIRALTNNNAFGKLVRFLALDVEDVEQNIIKGDEQKFWFCQGAKHILFQLLKFSEVTKKRILILSGAVSKEGTGNQSADPSYES